MPPEGPLENLEGNDSPSVPGKLFYHIFVSMKYQWCWNERSKVKGYEVLFVAPPHSISLPCKYIKA